MVWGQKTSKVLSFTQPNDVQLGICISLGHSIGIEFIYFLNSGIIHFKIDDNELENGHCGTNITFLSALAFRVWHCHIINFKESKKEVSD